MQQNKNNAPIPPAKPPINDFEAVDPTFCSDEDWLGELPATDADGARKGVVEGRLVVADVDGVAVFIVGVYPASAISDGQILNSVRSQVKYLLGGGSPISALASATKSGDRVNFKPRIENRLLYVVI